MVFTRSNLVKAALGPGVGLVLIALMWFEVIPAYQAYSVALAAVYAIVVLSVGLLAGWSGVWSVAHPAFFAVGAYFAAYGSGHQWPLELVILGAVASSALMGAFLGYAGARFSVLYIALLTLAFSLVSLEVINRWTGVTGGDQGVAVSQLDSALGLVSIPSGGAEAQYLAVLAAGIVLAIAVFGKSTGLRMRMVAAKAHPPAARSVGIAPEAQSALSFAVSAGFTGFAGVLLGLITGFVSPEPFSLGFGITLIAACVLGGVGTVAGAVVGGVYLAWVPTVAAGVSVPQPVVQGVLLIAALIFLPGGVAPFAAATARRVLGMSGRREVGSEHDAEHHAGEEGAPVAHERDRPDDHGHDGPVQDDREPLLVVDDLSVRFGGLKALEGASLAVRPGEVLAIIGPNGAGKTTLVNVVSGLIGGARISGTARYAGRNLVGTRATARRGLKIGRTFQHAESFSELTVVENVLCTSRWVNASDRARAAELLARTGLADVAGRYPAELPFGLQKRLDLARAMAGEPVLLILDEPFGGLDATERRLTAQQIARLRAQGAAVVIIDHVLDDLFAVADRVVAFDFGKPIGSGTPDAILRDPQVRSSYLGSVAAPAELPAVRDSGTAAVAVRDVSHHYGGVAALHGVDLDIGTGAVIGVVGANGAGKSTLGRIIHGSLRPSSGQVVIGEGDGRRIRASLVPEGRALFKTLSLRENLEVAGYAAGLKGSDLRARLDEVAEWLPERLRGRLSVAAAGLSGGEQQILAIARALMARPDVLILDEPALGLAPALVDEVYARINRLARDGMTVVLLEQLLSRALTSCHAVVVLHEGRVAARGQTTDPLFAERAERAYFGGATEAVLTTGLTIGDVNKLEA
ncbi:ATP-binding cassette domain-containing protein [Nonomuraea basaltis]|uniref:ATP-binding cassette domain-containing protein n=1 Tax=Nonomuraea basaltis TaxID=2495887 RepID=UPI00110C402D|nr:ATP-binding cassette domain-containing protein [Nonomuraea basaltis]TMR94062.1 ATP-binding cassette domain-containing protein [Nonomuraea basaltis]